MKLKNIKKVFALLAFPLLLTSCELFGLDFQDSYDFDYNEGMPSNKVNMSLRLFNFNINFLFIRC